MDNSLDMIQDQVNKIKESLLVQLIENPDSFVSPSAYDTAWLAMVGDPTTNNEKPMFRVCLDWILSNQKEEGFWGERDCYGNPTIDSLPSTLACMVALKMWDWGHGHIEKGMAFLRKNSSKKLLKREGNDDKAYPRWFAIVFPGMIEIARQRGLQVLFEEDEIKIAIAQVFFQQRDILQTENLVNKYGNHPLLSYLEVLPSSYPIDEETIINNLCDDGSLFQSPAASVAAYLATNNPKTMSYLCNLVQNHHSRGVPSMYPIDEDCIKLYMVNHLQRLGLYDLFEDEIKAVSDDIYREYNKQEVSKQGFVQANVFKSSLAFEVLRNQGYKVSPWMFCRMLLTDDHALQHIQDNHEMYSSMMYNVYRATNLMFESEEEMKGLRSFSRRLLEHSRLSSKSLDDGSIMWPHLQESIKRELLVPWMARMDHLDHRAWIEANMDSPLFLGKASFYRITCLDNKDLLQLAKDYYEYQQMVYKKELVELLRWSKEWGIPNMGFARDKTTYCYFAIASSSSLPYDTDIRLIVAKSAVIITIFDDFFDMEGSLNELEILANAIQKWDNTGLRTQSKLLFDVLDDFVGDTAKKFFDQHQIDITNHLRNIWCEVVDSWLTEATWSKTGKIPSKASYIEIGMISIAAHTLVLQASCFLTTSFAPCNLNPSKYEVITKLLMTACRLLNDIQSYEKEVKDGKINSVLLHLKENEGANMEDAIDYVENILEGTKMRLLEHALMDDDETGDEMPRSCKMLHLHALKVFQMFFNSGNHFDSKDSLLNDINKAIFVPFDQEDHNTSLELDNNPPNNKPLKLPSTKKKIPLTVNSHFCAINLNNYGRRTQLTMKQNPLAMLVGSFQSRMKIAPSCSFRFAC